jgi:hypothetical protein
MAVANGLLRRQELGLAEVARARRLRLELRLGFNRQRPLDRPEAPTGLQPPPSCLIA